MIKLIMDKIKAFSLKKSLLSIFFCCFSLFCLFGQSDQGDPIEVVHKAHLVSSWYPQDKQKLLSELDGYFAFAKKEFSFSADSSKVRVLVVPHAGYFYSGICAASAYQAIKDAAFSRVIILSPSHTQAFSGVALPDYGVYSTALGNIPVDKVSVQTLKKNDLFSISAAAHKSEHAVEVQLPFLQYTLKKFSIVPLIIGSLTPSDYDRVAKEIAGLIDASTLVVISSDFVHYGLNYGYTPFKENIFYQLSRLDSLAIHAITEKSFERFDTLLQQTKATICGVNAIKIVLKMIENKVFGVLYPRVAAYYNSAQISLARGGGASVSVKDLISRVDDVALKNSVSYAGIVLTQESSTSIKKEDSLTGYEKLLLLKLARDVIKNELSEKKIEKIKLYPFISPGLEQLSGVFVTLNKKDGTLRGCIGRIVSDQPLYKTVLEMAESAAFHDGRFSPVRLDELNDIVIDITVLTLPKRIDSYKDIKLGKHGIILNKLGRRSVFLPQVPGSFGWDLPTTLEHLSIKAGFDKDAWQNGSTFEVFEGFEFKES